MRKVSRAYVLSSIITFLIPVLGVIFTFINIRDGKERKYFVLLSIFAFSVIYFIPPYQDLFRRYTLQFLAYNDGTTYMQAIDGHVDIIMYVVILFFKKNDIPFFIFPALQSAISVYLFLSATKDVIDSNENYSHKNVIYLLSFLMVNFVGIALGLRFGFAVAMFTKSVTLVILARKRFSGGILMLLSALMHFSLILPIAIFLSSKFIKINKKLTPIFCIVAFLLSKFLIYYILNHLNLGNINDYAKDGYVEGKYAAADNSGNAMVVTYYRYLYMIVIYLLFFFSKKQEDEKLQKLENFINIFIISCFFTAISATAFNRYFNGIAVYFIFMLVLSVLYVRFDKVVRMIFVILVVFNSFFQSVYLLRRPIILGEMWRGLYTPVIFVVNYSDKDFSSYLKVIDSDGDWVAQKYSAD